MSASQSNSVESATVFTVLTYSCLCTLDKEEVFKHTSSFKEIFFLLFIYVFVELVCVHVSISFLPLMSLSDRHSQIMFNYECFSVINVNADLHGVLC